MDRYISPVIPDDALRALRCNDPDGWECVEPTSYDRAAFVIWAYATYPTFAEAYFTGGRS